MSVPRLQSGDETCNRDARIARSYAKLGARRRARRVAWKAAAGDADRYTEIMRGHIASPGYLYYDDEGDQPSSTARVSWVEIWRELRAQTADVLFVCALGAAVLILSDRLG